MPCGFCNLLGWNYPQFFEVALLFTVIFVRNLNVLTVYLICMYSVMLLSYIVGYISPNKIVYTEKGLKVE